jgi:hypothetical protein
MSAASSAAMVAALSATPYALVAGAMVGSLDASVDDSPLIGLLVANEIAMLSASGQDGAVLFTSARVIVAEQAGILNKRLAVKSFSRQAIIAYAIDPDTHVTLTLSGAFGTAALVFASGFDPMVLSQWLGETLAPKT